VVGTAVGFGAIALIRRPVVSKGDPAVD